MANDAERDRLIEELQAENERLRAGSPGGATDSPRTWRWPLAVTLLILGAVLLAVAIPAMWAGRTLLDTDRYTETVAPLASDPAVRQSVATSAVDRLFSQADVAARVRNALPPDAAFIAPQITAGLQEFSVTAAQRALETPQFATLWTEANRAAHERIVPALLTGTAGQTGALSVEQGTVAIDLTRIVTLVKQALVSRGLSAVENVPDDIAGGSVVLFQSAQLAQIQTLLQAVRTLSVLLPILAVLMLAGAVAVAPDRRRALFWVGLTSIVSMLVLGVGLALARDAYVSSPPAGILSGAAAVSFFDTIVRFLRNSIRTVAALGLVLLIGAAFAGPSTLAVRTRSAFSNGTAALGLDLGRPAEWTDRHRRGLETVLLVIAAIVLLTTNTPTPGLVLGLTAAVLVGFILVEFVSHSHPPAGSGPSGEPSM